MSVDTDRPSGRGRRRRRLARWLRRVVVLGGVAAAAGAFRNRQIDANRKRYDLP